MDTRPFEHGIYLTCIQQAHIHYIVTGKRKIIKFHHIVTVIHAHNHITPIHQSKETDSRHSMPGGKPVHTVRNGIPTNMFMKTNQSPTKYETWTRSGQVSCRPERLRVNT